MPSVLRLMRKPQPEKLKEFKTLFDQMNREEGRKQFLSYYFIAAHPGCTEKDMRNLKSFALHELRATPQQIQIFTPLPSTWSALMYWTGIDPKTGRKIYVEKDLMNKQRQKGIATARRKPPGTEHQRICVKKK